MCDTVRLINAWMWLVYWFLDEDRLKNRASDSKRNKADRQKYVLGLYKTEVYRYTLQMDPNAVLGITMIHQWMFHVFFSLIGCPAAPVVPIWAPAFRRTCGVPWHAWCSWHRRWSGTAGRHLRALGWHSPGRWSLGRKKVRQQPRFLNGAPVQKQWFNQEKLGCLVGLS